jgi:arginyl-tRNA synthetase
MKEDILKIFKDAGIAVKESQLEAPPDPKFGDMSCTVAFEVAKKKGKNPAEVAAEIAAKLNVTGVVSQIKVAGPYINFFFDRDKAAKKMLELLDKAKFKKKKEKVMVEYANINTHKPIHIGHLRNISLGESLSRILELCGYNTVRAYYINDYGMHVAKTIWYLMSQKTKRPKENLADWLGEIYVKATKKIKDSPELGKEANKVLQLMEQRDPEVMKVWKETWKWSMDDFWETFAELGSPKFDAQLYEHQVFDAGKKISEDLLEKGIAKRSEGAIIVDLGKYGLGVYVLIKSDGAALYQTADLELAKKKFREYDIDISIYVVASEQKLYFKQIFKTLELMGFKRAKDCHHLSYELVYLKEGKMSSREGTLITYRQLKEKMMKKAFKEVMKRNKGMAKARALKLAKQIFLAAVKYGFLKVENNKKFVFDWRSAMEFEGDTGPYIQYSAVRARRILEKRKKGGKFSSVEKDIEYDLVRKLYRFEEVVSKAAEKRAPNLVANYAAELAKTFSEFYSQCKVIGSDYESSRLAIVEAYCNTISKCLDLLGIDVPERM